MMQKTNFLKMHHGERNIHYLIQPHYVWVSDNLHYRYLSFYLDKKVKPVKELKQTKAKNIYIRLTEQP